MSWNVPENKLSVRQRAVMDMLWKNTATRHWIQGCAGSGKTLVLLHAMERLATQRPTESICFLTFTHALKDLVRTGLSQVVSGRVVVMTHTEFLAKKRKFDHVFLDEVQDISKRDLEGVMALAGNLQIAGDPDQRIYSNGTDESQVNLVLKPKSERLFDVYRLSSLLRKLALSVLPSTHLVEGRDKGTGPTYQIKVLKFDDENAEAAWMFTEARACAKGGYNASAILFSTHDQIKEFSEKVARFLGKPIPPEKQKQLPRKTGPSQDYTAFNDFWRAQGIPLAYLGNGNGDFSQSETQPMVFLMTYHSSKGLDFESVFLPNINKGLYLGQADALQADPDAERRLMYVAITRSRTRLFVSYTRELHPLLRNHPRELVVEFSPKLRSSGPAEGLF